MQFGGMSTGEDPNYYSGQSLPLTIHKGGTTVIGSNWYYTGVGNGYFNSSKGSSLVSLGNEGDFYILNRPGGPTAPVQTIYLSNNNKVGIGSNWSSTVLPAEALDVTGNIKTSGLFKGDGSYITNLNASNITSGTISLSRLTNGTSGYVLSGGSTTPTYINPMQLTVGTSSISGTSSVSNAVKLSTSSSSSSYILFSSSSTGNGLVNTNSVLTYNGTTGVINTGGLLINNISSPSIMIGNTNNYFIQDKAYSGLGYLSTGSHLVTLDTITLTSGILCVIEAIFACKVQGTGNGATLYYSSCKLSGLFYHNGANVVQYGTTTTTNLITNTSGSWVLTPNFSYSLSNVYLQQTVSGVGSHFNSVVVSYTVTAIN
jgi:hypothetical protein